MKIATYDIFKKEFVRYIFYSQNDIDLVLTDKRLLNSLTDDQKAIIPFVENDSVVEIYKKYIVSNIDILLRSRFGDISINNAWNDIVPSLIRI